MTLTVYSPERYMKEAFRQAQLAYEQGEVPVGAVVVAKNRIIARAHNQVELLNDPTAHAEILAITTAAEFLGSKFLNDCTMYVTLEPCVMCAGALNWAQIDTIYYGASDGKRGYTLIEKNILHPKTKINTGIMANECQKLLEDFFKNLREE
ncbi:MAG: nucleoside deaminase [Cyclobacteriaceae bacterium]|nr:nucleoside deaminase [Cyclobacteriaceae bacterium]